MVTTPEEFEFVKRIMQSDHVRSKLDEVADRVAARVNAVTGRDGYSSKTGPRANVVTRAKGTRPGTKSPIHAERPYSRVGITFRTRKQALDDIAQANGAGVASSAVAGARNPNP